jgi:hypothetical protein
MPDARLVRRVVLWFLIAAIGLPPSPAAAAGGRDQWSRVTALKPNTHLIVAVVGRPGTAGPSGNGLTVLEGWLASADAGRIVLGCAQDARTRSGATYTRSDDVEIPRERVVQVVVVKEGRPWWAIPLGVAAVAGSILLCVGILWALDASGSNELPSSDDSAYGPFTIFALPVLTGIWAYRKLDDVRRSEKVIYVAPAPIGQAGR